MGKLHSQIAQNSVLDSIFFVADHGGGMTRQFYFSILVFFALTGKIPGSNPDDIGLLFYLTN